MEIWQKPQENYSKRSWSPDAIDSIAELLFRFDFCENQDPACYRRAIATFGTSMVDWELAKKRQWLVVDYQGKKVTAEREYTRRAKMAMLLVMIEYETDRQVEDVE